MLRKRFSSNGYGQLRWVILLLAIAVILPTVCLLWFMNQAVKNVQLAARQKLITLYEEKLATASQDENQSWSEQFEGLDKLVDQNLPSEFFDNLFEARHHPVIVYDEDGRRIYPLISADVNVPVDPAEQFRDAWRLEFAEQKLTEAIKLYEEETQSNNTYVRLSALIGKARCLTKLGSSDQAVEVYKKVAFCPEEATCDTATLMLIANTRLLLAELVKLTLEKHETLTYPVFQEELSKLLQIIRGQNEAGTVLPLDRSIFLAYRFIEFAGGAGSLTESYEMYPDMHMETYDMGMEHPMDLQFLMGVLNEGELTLAVIERFPTAAELRDWPVDQFRQLQLDEHTFCYGAKHNAGDTTILLLLSDGTFGLSYKNNFRGTGVAYRVLDNLGRVAGGLDKSRGSPFLTARIGKCFADWQVELYFEDDDILEGAARKQITLYVWAGVLVIVLILAAGGFAGQAVTRQIKLNRLKNDFIATVSHELRTPLASMRVLADTLLEGNYKDQQQATEYLRLICKENKRLSGLIDNFLTFSRMERNKQAFQMVRTSSAAIASSAADAVTTEFSEGRCEFQVQITENLPDVLADQNAIVTVLVNLLDNAYKYSADDKKIALKVLAEDDSVCFRVCDNGVGMSRRAAKKIFERFYQVDRSLSRRTEGCGLGLSIAKFIVDAHKGSISVDSKPGEGSTFTVELPVVN
ncbi:MAG: ATP-binding protein [Planctomycetota bacterium]|nr:ATP-binding protein [Planctomycetota bacterium]